MKRKLVIALCLALSAVLMNCNKLPMVSNHTQHNNRPNKGRSQTVLSHWIHTNPLSNFWPKELTKVILGYLPMNCKYCGINDRLNHTLCISCSQCLEDSREVSSRGLYLSHKSTLALLYDVFDCRFIENKKILCSGYNQVQKLDLKRCNQKQFLATVLGMVPLDVGIYKIIYGGDAVYGISVYGELYKIGHGNGIGRYQNLKIKERAECGVYCWGHLLFGGRYGTVFQVDPTTHKVVMKYDRMSKCRSVNKVCPLNRQSFLAIGTDGTIGLYKNGKKQPISVLDSKVGRFLDSVLIANTIIVSGEIGTAFVEVDLEKGKLIPIGMGEKSFQSLVVLPYKGVLLGSTHKTIKLMRFSGNQLKEIDQITMEDRIIEMQLNSPGNLLLIKNQCSQLCKYKVSHINKKISNLL